MTSEDPLTKASSLSLLLCPGKGRQEAQKEDTGTSSGPDGSQGLEPGFDLVLGFPAPPLSRLIPVTCLLPSSAPTLGLPTSRIRGV